MLLYCFWANSQVQNPYQGASLHHPTFVAILMSGHFNFLFLGRGEGSEAGFRCDDVAALGNSELIHNILFLL